MRVMREFLAHLSNGRVAADFVKKFRPRTGYQHGAFEGGGALVESYPIHDVIEDARAVASDHEVVQNHMVRIYRNDGTVTSAEPPIRVRPINEVHGATNLTSLLKLTNEVYFPICHGLFLPFKSKYTPYFYETYETYGTSFTILASLTTTLHINFAVNYRR